MLPPMYDRPPVSMDSVPACVPIEQGDQPLLGRENSPVDAPFSHRRIESCRVSAYDPVVTKHECVAVQIRSPVDIGPDAAQDQWASKAVAVENWLRA